MSIVKTGKLIYRHSMVAIDIYPAMNLIILWMMLLTFQQFHNKSNRRRACLFLNSSGKKLKVSILATKCLGKFKHKVNNL